MTVNLFFIIILVSLLVELVLETVADVLNLKAIRFELPPELEGIYKPEDYRKSQEYLRANTRFEIATRSFSSLVLLTFWFTGGFNFLDELVRGLGYPPVVNGLLYLGILGAAYSLLTLPFSIYATFVIEERFGFNRTTPGTFILDKGKGLALSVLIGGPLLAGILALFQYGGPLAWLYGWLASIIFMLGMGFIAPVWLMPLFNKFTPMPEGELKEAILKQARTAGYAIKNIFIVDSSKRSTKTNAFFTGLGKTKRIALFDTLVEKHPTPELVAVLAHEIGHYKRKHTLLGIAISILQMGIALYLFSLVLNMSGLYQAFGMSQPSIYTGIIFFSLLLTPAEMLLNILLAMLSRKNETDADRYSVESIEEPENMANALRRLSADNLSNLTPHPFYVFMHYSHPPLLARLRAIREYRMHHLASKADV